MLAVIRFLVVIIAVLGCATVAHSDGIIAKKGGGFVSESEQHAFIEWEASQERLYVKTQSEKTDKPTVWIIPIPCEPGRVSAKPIERMPSVYQPYFPIPRARENLQQTRELALMWDTGYMLSPVRLFFQSVGSQPKSVTFSTADSALGAANGGSHREPLVVVHSHIEALGMVVEVLTAKDGDALNKYFQQKQLDIKAEQLTSLKEYFGAKNGAQYSFVCSWRGDTPGTGRAVVIDFACPQPFYPLLPTRANPTPVETTVYLRGWYQATTDMRIPGLACHRMLGKIVVPTDDAALGRSGMGSGLTPSQLEAVRVRPVTKITLSPNPADWHQDLTLESSNDVRETVAGWIAGRTPTILVMASAVLGILIAPLMLLFIRQRSVTWRDTGYALLTGAGLAGTPLVCSLFYYLWRRNEPADSTTNWASSDPFTTLGLVVFLFFIPAWIIWLVCYRCQRTCWELLLLILAHLGLVTLVCYAMQDWFSVG
ncbi:MAG: hypothetical protein JNJ77_04540 [Planctomycetia bacterium]|nr:hypothetical protein [Planctomycetia bacterium]